MEFVLILVKSDQIVIWLTWQSDSKAVRILKTKEVTKKFEEIRTHARADE